jgi:hypothetical protein
LRTNLKKIQNYNYQEIKSLLFFVNMKINTCRTVILPVILYGCETWSVTMRVKSRRRVFENRVLRKLFWPSDELMGRGENYITSSFMICIPH